MTTPLLTSPRRGALLGALALAAVFSVSCSDDKTAPPTLTTLTVTLPLASIQVGQPDSGKVAGVDQHSTSIPTGTIAWSSSAATIAKVDATTGVVTGVAAGTAQITATAGLIVGQQTVTVVAPAGIKLNEVESNGGTPGDWTEFYNPTAATVDLSGWVVKDNDDTHIFKVPAGTTIAAGGYYVAEEAGFGFGLGAPDSVRLYSPFGVEVDRYGWDQHAATTYGRCPNGSGAFATTTSSTKGTANDCSVAVKINEVESNGGTPGDWIELYNAGGTTVDLSGYILRDNDDTHSYALPAGTTIAAGAYYVAEEAQFVFGLGAPDAARLFSPTGTLVDSYSWDTHATTTYGRCPNGTGAFATTASSTKGAANDCGTSTGGGATASPWPGGTDIATVDGNAVFGGNLSGLAYEGANGATPAVMWAVRNGPGTLYRLIFNGTIWTPDPANGWANGKALHYADGTGDPDSEGVGYAVNSAGGMYVSTERNNSNNGVSKNAILRFDPSGSATSLNATNVWDLTADLPVTGANLGAEAVTWIPDTFLTSNGFFDENAGHAYNPTEYANHGTGLFFVGLEANGNVYVYALDHTANTFKRIATMSTGFPGVMDLNFDRELGYLWGVCDDGCNGQSVIFEIDTAAASATKGRFKVTHLFDRPSGMPNFNNEGFTVTPQSECVSGVKPAYWADDTEDNGHAIRKGSVSCNPFAASIRRVSRPVGR